MLSLLRRFAERYPLLAMGYRSLRDHRRFLRPPAVTPWGFEFAGDPRMMDGTFEAREVDAFRDLLDGADVFVNVGANAGYYCCLALDRGAERVIAFEPLPENVRLLCRNVDRNGWQGVEIYPVALGRVPGVARLYGGGTGASLIAGWANATAGYRTLVPVNTLDNVLGGRLAGARVLVLVDVEGAERAVLEGAETLLAQSPKPVWIVEIMSTVKIGDGYRVNPDLASTFSLFRERGYRSFTVGAERREVTESEVADAATGRRPLPAYNFLFTE